MHVSCHETWENKAHKAVTGTVLQNTEHHQHPEKCMLQFQLIKSITDILLESGMQHFLDISHKNTAFIHSL